MTCGLHRALFDMPPFGPVALGEPTRIIATDEPSRVPAALAEVEAEALRGRWAAGFVAYEAAVGLEPAFTVRPPRPGPLVWFGIHDAALPPSPPRDASARLSALAPELERGDYLASARAIRAAIERGDAYQVNLTLRMRGRFDGDPLALYDRLRRAQPGYTACLVLDGRAIVSASPELFFLRTGDRAVVRPMKGTAVRGRYAEEDDRTAAALAACPKERAENVMIVDVLRNDLGQVARTGSVRTAALCQVERYRTVLQMTSTVEAELQRGVGLAELFAALFPSGSVTGAPKVKATAFIAHHERSPRGPYCGAVGLVTPGGDAVFNVSIRTLDLDLDRGTAAYGIGGGITYASSPEREWEEAIAKASVLADPVADFDLLETLRLCGGSYARLDRHLARLAASARYFGIACDVRAVRDALEAEAGRAGRGGRRVRLLLGADGRPRTEAGPLPPQTREPLPVALARRPVHRGDRFLFHKTTRRAAYEQRRGERPELFDVLLSNEEGELTEFTIGNLVAEIDGERRTPARDCGLLAGVMRAELLDRGEAREAVLRAVDLVRARRLWLVNSLREMVPVRIV